MFIYKMKKVRLKILLIKLFIIGTLPVYAGHFKVIGMSEGLPNNTIKCITQDKQGFIWFGTFNGLSRYDGVSFTTYRNVPSDSSSLINNHIESLLAVEKGLWIGTSKGLSYYSFCDNQFYICRNVKDQTPIQQYIKNIVKVGDDIYVLDNNRQVKRWVSNYSFVECEGLLHNYCLAITPYKEHALLVLTMNGIILFDTIENRIKAQIQFKLYNSPHHSIYYSNNTKNIYIGGGLGYPTLAYSLSEDFIFQEIHKPFPSDVKQVLDYDDAVLFATDVRGIIKIDCNGERTTFSPSNSNISSEAIHSLFIDKNDDLWIGTYRAGLNYYSKRFSWFKTLSMQSGEISHNVVTAILPYKDVLYIGLDGGGLNIYNVQTNKTQIYTTQNSQLPGNHILSLFYDEQYLWMGVYTKGLCRFNLDSKQFKTYPIPHTSNQVWGMKEDEYNRIWVIGEGVRLFDKKTETFTSLSVFENQTISGICFYNDYVWISSSSNGLYKLDRKNCKVLKHYHTNSQELSLIDNDIRFLFVDTKGNVWFATEHSSLYKLTETDKQINSYRVMSRMDNNSIVSIVEDGRQNYWIATTHGLYRFHPEADRLILYDSEDNLPLSQFNYYAGYYDSETIYMGAVGGVVAFKPAEVVPRNYSNNVIFTYLDFGDDINKNIYLYGQNTQKIQLKSNQNFFTLHYATPEFVSPSKVNFACYMENFEKDWRFIDNQRSVSYTNVSPGTYKFFIKSGVEDGRWHNSVSCLEIEVFPPWWKTIWATILWVFLLLSFFYLIVWFYLREQKIRHRIELNEMEKNTTKTISEAKLMFFTNISHELRTPVFLIMAHIEELLHNGKGPITVSHSYLSTMYHNALRLNKLINRIVDFRKLEKGKLKLELQSQNVVTFCKDLTVNYEELCKQKNILFYYQPTRTLIPLHFDAEKLEIILTNLVSNAFKYTQEGGRILFNIEDKEDSVEFVIEDNGIGIKKEYHEAVFDRFFQVDPSDNANVSDGIGLSFVKHLVELHGGKVWVESELHKGSRFIFNIPRLSPSEDVNETPCCDESEQKQTLVSNVTPKPELLPSPANVRTILIIDDERETLELLERNLIEDYRILKATNGVDGLAITQDHLPDLVICDVMMPQMNGTEYLSIIKKDGKLSHIPVIMFTAMTSEEEQMAAFDCGADAYLTKPISLKYLRNRIRHLLTRSESVEFVKTISQTEKKYTKEEQRFLLKCREIIEMNLTKEDFNVQQMAQELGMSHSTLYRKMKAVSGMSLIEFVNEYRVFKAVQYFREGETSVNLVSVKCGFNDIKNFRIAFKKKMKMTPSEYMQRM